MTVSRRRESVSDGNLETLKEVADIRPT